MISLHYLKVKKLSIKILDIGIQAVLQICLKCFLMRGNSIKTLVIGM